jgi:hypothetical protein
MMPLQQLQQLSPLVLQQLLPLLQPCCFPRLYLQQ